MSNDPSSDSTEPKNALARLWQTLRRPTSKYSLLSVLIVGGIGGIVFWGGFNTAMEATNTLEFCISCHEMRDNVYVEYQKTVHYQNRTGVRAVCSDCHVPKEWTYKIKRKIQATNELWHKMLGSVDTPEKFDAKRLELAKHEWERLKKNDSLECRNCHSFSGMKTDLQKDRAKKYHELGQKKGETCIDCHKGIAHKPVHKQLEASEEEDTL